MSLSTIDFTVLLAYILFIIWWALKNGKTENSDDYFLAGRNLSWPMIGLSLFAASVSSSTLMGHSGEGFISGIAVFNYNWISVLVLAFFATFFLPFYIRSGIFTMPEFLERRFDGRSRTYFSFITIIGNVFLDAAATLYTGALIIKMIFPEAEIVWIIIGMAAVAGSYTIIGGLSSAINADMIQATILIIGSGLLFFFALKNIGGWETFVERFNDGFWLKLTRPLDDPTVPWLGMWVGIPILGFYFWANNQVMVQRVLSAKSVDHGRKGVLLVGFLYLLTIFIFIIPGLIARGIDLYGVENLPHKIISGSVLKQEYGINTDQVYPRLILELLPIGLIGIILSAMISALTSTLSATLSSVSTLFTMDFYSKIDKNASSKKKVQVGQFTAVITLIIAVIWAPYIREFDSLIAYYQEIVSYLAPPIVGTFFLGLFWKRANGTGAITGLFSGLFVAATIMIMKYTFDIDMGLHFLLLAPILLVISLFITIVISLVTSPPSEEKVVENTWTVKIWKEETKAMKEVVWYKNFRVQVVALIIACFGMYAAFF
ncbi:sodium:solute symporter [Zunongwangia profunda]|nr:sodium:solute symporter [Zunongwangia profunda]MCC4226803.1 sodium:solute symporter [Zunongwangia profunda]|tara:strand:+ start:22 stop:1656 length:1635 start_codon:yes stop_codon:yes gene_type:complete